MLVVLMEQPATTQEWERWSFHHRDHHTEIRQAIEKQKHANLTEYPLDPIPADIRLWLIWNQQTHNDMNGVLNLQGSDLEGVDFEQNQGVKEWIYNHYLEHFAAAAALGI